MIQDEDPDFLVAGTITAGWRERRRLVTVTLEDPLPFVDVEDPATHESPTTALASTLSGLAVSMLDVPTVRGPDRRVTRALTAWVQLNILGRTSMVRAVPRRRPQPSGRG